MSKESYNYFYNLLFDNANRSCKFNMAYPFVANNSLMFVWLKPNYTIFVQTLRRGGYVKTVKITKYGNESLIDTEHVTKEQWDNWLHNHKANVPFSVKFNSTDKLGE